MKPFMTLLSLSMTFIAIQETHAMGRSPTSLANQIAQAGREASIHCEGQRSRVIAIADTENRDRWIVIRTTPTGELIEFLQAAPSTQGGRLPHSFESAKVNGTTLSRPRCGEVPLLPGLQVESFQTLVESISDPSLRSDCDRRFRALPRNRSSLAGISRLEAALDANTQTLTFHLVDPTGGRNSTDQGRCEVRQERSQILDIFGPAFDGRRRLIALLNSTAPIFAFFRSTEETFNRQIAEMIDAGNAEGAPLSSDAIDTYHAHARRMLRRQISAKEPELLELLHAALTE